MELTGLGALSGIGEAFADRRTIADNFDTFLQLLTTQLRNQNPLEPLNANEFTQQLVQFSSVEQAIKTNENLETLLRLSVANTATAAVGYIGKTISANGATAQLKNGQASWDYQANGAITNATVAIRDSAGRIVFSEDRTMTASKGTFQWDGRRSDGSIAPAGAYQIQIIGRDGNGRTIDVDTSTRGVVDGVDLSGTEPVLLIGDTRVKLSAVKSIVQG